MSPLIKKYVQQRLDWMRVRQYLGSIRCPAFTCWQGTCWKKERTGRWPHHAVAASLMSNHRLGWTGDLAILPTATEKKYQVTRPAVPSGHVNLRTGWTELQTYNYKPTSHLQSNSKHRSMGTSADLISDGFSRPFLTYPIQHPPEKPEEGPGLGPSWHRGWPFHPCMEVLSTCTHRRLCVSTHQGHHKLNRRKSFFLWDIDHIWVTYYTRGLQTF